MVITMERANEETGSKTLEINVFFLGKRGEEKYDLCSIDRDIIIL